ncbi:UTP--glucose-1-phosphate uridylyltransferase [bacterium]|nr:UTP--glucose-1-phosphate uridylyltransferase [bacterium]
MEHSIEAILASISEKGRQHDLSEHTLMAFLGAVKKVGNGESGQILESQIEPVSALPHSDSLAQLNKSEIEPFVKQLAVVKLNGGLGTGMGLAGPKSLLRVKGEDSFLDIIAKQIMGFRERFGGHLPGFYLMNSFSTQAETLAFLRKYPDLSDSNGRLDFLQGKVPKLLAETLFPAVYDSDPELEWCPPGHGDIYPSLDASGLLKTLLDQGVKYLFVSNSDNLGATVDFSLLSHFASSGAGFMMEVARRTGADRKGGHLAKRRGDGRLILRESAQCVSSETDQFQDVDRYAYFNTNNLWIQIEHLKAELDRREAGLELPIIQNQKSIDPCDSSSAMVLQLESAMGAAIECFDQSIAVEVPRSRFSPVKTTADLLSLWSDAYVLTEDHRLVLDERRQGHPPVVSLDSSHFKFIADFERHFPEGVPSMIDCEKLDVVGDVRFASGVVCRGAVRFENKCSDSRMMEAGTYEDVSVTL